MWIFFFTEALDDAKANGTSGTLRELTFSSQFNLSFCFFLYSYYDKREWSLGLWAIIQLCRYEINFGENMEKKMHCMSHDGAWNEASREDVINNRQFFAALRLWTRDMIIAGLLEIIIAVRCITTGQVEKRCKAAKNGREKVVRAVHIFPPLRSGLLPQRVYVRFSASRGHHFLASCENSWNLDKETPPSNKCNSLFASDMCSALCLPWISRWFSRCLIVSLTSQKVFVHY